eukprot:TRINITY_DN6292_c0_g1_i4.p1 TRINITY_DN6292_c0_g1~~TRINITY_DN6292_c0_g1_i4.p1  ORF type:complete len:217 (+),score=25.87 TRINITY_DN6292_c0_g1_i4:60-653(+)
MQSNFPEKSGNNDYENQDVVTFDHPHQTRPLRDVDSLRAARQITFAASRGKDESDDRIVDDDVRGWDRPQRTTSTRDLDAFVGGQINISESSGDDESDRRPSHARSENLDPGEGDALPRGCARGEDWSNSSLSLMQHLQADESTRSDVPVEQADGSASSSAAAIGVHPGRADEPARAQRESILAMAGARRAQRQTAS